MNMRSPGVFANFARLLALGGVALTASSPACAENWVEVTRSGGGDIYYYDTANVAESGAGRLTYSAKVEFVSSASIEQAILARRALGLPTKGYSDLKFSFALEEIDCKLSKVRNLAGLAVDRNNKVLDEHKAEGPWDDIRAGTLHERFRKLLCH